MSTLITITLALAYGAVFGAFLAISFAIRREDKRRSLAWGADGMLAGGAGGRTEQSARSITGWHRARWA